MSMLTRGLAEALENELDECLRMMRDASAAFRIFAGMMKSEGAEVEAGNLEDFVNSQNFFSECGDVCSVA